MRASVVLTAALLGGAGAFDCDQEARESRIRRQVPAVA